MTDMMQHIEALERGIAELRQQAQDPPNPTRPITVAELSDRAAEHPLENLFDLTDALVQRIVARAKYDALKEMLAQVDGWIEGAKENHGALDHRDERAGEECWTRFHSDDIRNMVNDAARSLRVRDPWGGKSGEAS